MFVKIDHVGWCGDIKTLRKELIDKDYLCKFEAVLVKNSRIKEKLLQRYSPEHKLSFFEKKGYLSIECLEHTAVSDKSKSFIADVYLKDKTEILIKCSSNKKMSDFLACFGCCSGNDSRSVFKSLLDNTQTIFILKQEENTGNFLLDAEGFNSIAFLVSGIEKKKNFFTEKGYRVSDIDEIVINENKLRVCFVFGPDGQPVELIEPVGGKNGNS